MGRARDDPPHIHVVTHLVCGGSALANGHGGEAPRESVDSGSDVAFVDSSGVNVLLRARALLGREDRALAVVCPPGPARRVFDVAGIADLLVLFDSREEAATALQPAR